MIKVTKWIIVFILVLNFIGCGKELSNKKIYSKYDINKETNRAEKELKRLRSTKEARNKKNRAEKELKRPRSTKQAIKFNCNKSNTVDYTIATGSSTGTYYQIGKNLSEFVAKDACVNLIVLTSNGSIENVKRLSIEKGMKLAIVQSDVFQKFKDMAVNGNQQAKNIVRKLRVVKPLYFEEAHFIVRVDENANYIQDIKNLRINIGPEGSGTAMTTSNIYKEIFGVYIPLKNQSSYGYAEALQRLLRNDLDVVVYVSGQPTGRLDMHKSAKNKIKLLAYDDSSSLQSNSYYQADIKKSSYRWLDKNINTLAVKSYLITFNYKGSTRKPLARFSNALNKKFTILKSNGHPKWQAVNEDLKNLPGGWKYYEPTKFAYGYIFDETCYGQAKDLELCKLR